MAEHTFNIYMYLISYIIKICPQNLIVYIALIITMNFVSFLNIKLKYGKLKFINDFIKKIFYN